MFRCDAWWSAVGPRLLDARWRAELDRTRPLHVQLCHRLVVVTPHVDEDVCAVGGLLARAGEQAVRVDVLSDTDGDGGTCGEGPYRSGTEPVVHPHDWHTPRRAHSATAAAAASDATRETASDHAAVARAAARVCSAYHARLVHCPTRCRTASSVGAARRGGRTAGGPCDDAGHDEPGV